MNCGRVSNQLSAYIDRELTGAEILSIRSHLGGCDPCRAEYEALNRMKTMLGRLQPPEPRPDFVVSSLRCVEQTGVGVLDGGWPGQERPDFLLRWFMGRGSLTSLTERLRYVIRSARRNIALPGRAVLRGDHPRDLLKRESLRALAVGIPWPRLTLGATTGILAAVLVLTSVVWRHPRHPDALLATIPPRVVLGEDRQGQDLVTSPPLYFQLVSDGAASDFLRPHLFRSELPGSQLARPWTPVSFQGEGYGGPR